MKSSPFLLLILCLAPLWSGAAHITDELQIGLFDAPDTAGTPRRLLTSGEPVDVLSRADGLARVRLADNLEGWIEARYVSDRKPTKALLLETQAKLRRLGLEVAALRELRADAGDTGMAVTAGASQAPPSAREAALRRALEKTESRVAALEAELAAQTASAEAQRQLDDLQARVREALEVLSPGDPPVSSAEQGLPNVLMPYLQYLPWLAGIAALVLGFAAGMFFIDYRIRRRYGGFRI